MSEEVKDLTVAEFTEGIRNRMGEKPGINTTIKFVFDEGGIIFIDGKSGANLVGNDDDAADVTLKMSLETMNKLQRKEINGMTAFMSGKVKLEGDMLAAMKLDQILG
ncbi:MAG: SCP2 sterol-binding domain-containing protein [Blastocatellia bacterium]